MKRPFDRDGEALLRTLPVSDRAKTELLRRMGETSRHYHTMHHLDLIWARHLQYGSSTNLHHGAMEVPIACAIAYHDSVYVGGASDNEKRSAEFWLEVSALEGRLDNADRSWVADTILATASHIDAAKAIALDDPRGHARQWVLDLDLTPLGEAPDVFDENTRQLAAELPHLSETERRKNLLDALRVFARAQPLYRCPEIASAFESRARDNFARYLRADEIAAPRSSAARQ